jgi:hypothetical protein
VQAHVDVGLLTVAPLATTPGLEVLQHVPAAGGSAARWLWQLAEVG